MKKLHLRFITVIIANIIGIVASYSQKMDKTNATYFTSDHRNTYNLVQWKTEPLEQIAFCRDSSTRSEGYHLKIKNNCYPSLNNQPTSPFILDTTTYNESGYYYFYPHSSWFNQLQRVDLTYKAQPTIFGELANPGKYKKAAIKDLFKMLIQFNIVDTYDHLYAELIITKEKEDAEKIEITYHCMYHICTSKCFDPEYNFSLTYFKKTGELMAKTQ